MKTLILKTIASFGLIISAHAGISIVTVPESGQTLFLLAIALVGLAVWRHKGVKKT